MKASGEVKLFIGILIVALLLVSVALYPMLIKPKRPDLPPVVIKHAPPNVTRALLIPPGSHMRGSPKAPYTLVEFADFQCPSCKAGVDATERLLKTYKDKLNLVFHQYQVASTHFNAPVLARAAEAASQQGKFWEMHDKLFEQQEVLASEHDMQALTDLLAEIAGEVKLDVMKFRDTLASDVVKKMTARDDKLGDQLNIPATPTYYFVTPKGAPVILPNTQQMVDYLNNPKSWK